jgi:hypothetical protein
VFEGIACPRRLEGHHHHHGGHAMPDGQAYKLPDAPEQEVPADVQAPRLLNAAAWLEVLAALETEFATILGKNASSS